MSFPLDSIPVLTALFAVLASFFILRYLTFSFSAKATSLDEDTDPCARYVATTPTNAIRKLAAAFPSQVATPLNGTALAQFQSGYWAQQNIDTIPSCVVRPESTADVAKVLEILHEEHLLRQHDGSEHGYFFALRSGGHSVYNSALTNGIVVDMSAFNEVHLSQDRKTATIGSGARWGSVVDALEAQGLAVPGGRDAKVGAGGLILGGGISFFSPRYGFVASNVVSYEVVLASGEVITASEKEHPDLWKALKAGSSNFGILTRITLPTFPSSKIWAGYIYLPGFETRKTLAALHEWNMRGFSGKTEAQYDQDAAGPLGCFAYLNSLRIHAHAVYMVHTKAKDGQSGWPASFKASPFRSLWRFWSSVKVQTLRSSLDELSANSPNGKRQVIGTTTIISDLETLEAAYDIHVEAIEAIRSTRAVKGLMWNFITQPIQPQWATKGEPGPMGFSKSDKKPLMLICFFNSWDKKDDDHVIKSATRRAVEKIEAMARSKNTNHPYRYLNYCGNWQNPFESYGEENHKFLQEMSRKYDAQGLFQKTCTGGFKLFSKDV